MQNHTSDVFWGTLKVVAPACLGFYLAWMKFEYERGYCAYFGVPESLIRFETISLVVFSAKSLLFGGLAAMIGLAVLKQLPSVDFLRHLLFFLSVLAVAHVVFRLRLSTTITVFLYSVCLGFFADPRTTDRKPWPRWMLFATLFLIWGTTFALYLRFGHLPDFSDLSPRAFLMSLCKAAVLTGLPIMWFLMVRHIHHVRAHTTRSLDSSSESPITRMDMLLGGIPMAIILLFTPPYFCGLFGHNDAASRRIFAGIHDEADFVLIRQYGETIFFRQLLESPSGPRLGGQYRLLYEGDLSGKTLESRWVGQLPPYEPPVEVERSDQ